MFKVRPVISNPIGQSMQLFAEFFRWCVAEFVSHSLIIAVAVTGGMNPIRSVASDSRS
jgi:hypothetical protein